MSKRPALTAERIIEAAVQVADDGGLTQVSMRNVARQLDVQAMSLYHHIANKDQLLDGLAEWIFSQIALPAADLSWQEVMTQRANSAREVLRSHPWSLSLLESRPNPGPAVLRHHDALLGVLRLAGFSLQLASHALSVIDSYVYGFVLTELQLPFDPTQAEAADSFATEMIAELDAESFPNLAELTQTLVAGGSYVFVDEFDWGLELLLGGLAARLQAEQ